MELEQLDTLPLSDRWTFLVGRIAVESVAMDAALRGLHAQLRDREDRQALLDTHQNWDVVMKQCQKMLARTTVDDSDVSAAIYRATLDATAAWEERNRYLHDLLVEDVDDEFRPDRKRVERVDGDRYRVRLTSKKDTAAITVVTLQEARDVVLQLVAATWLLRAARGYLAGGKTWRTALLGELEGEWDGMAIWMYSGPDADDLDEEHAPVAPLLPND